MNFLNRIFLFVAARFVDFLTFFYSIIAKVFGYPGNPGMSVIKSDDIKTFFEASSYPRYIPPFNIATVPSTWNQAFFSKNPVLSLVPKFFYQSDSDGFYSFYIDLYNNNYFLPDWLSKWLQLTFNICLDTTNLERIQEAIFVFLIIYMKVIAFRINLFWFITINPFVRPWIYITSLVDWAYDLTTGIVPGLFGVDIGIVLFFSVIGKFTDIVNSLIFTMPFLPSEGEISFLENDLNRFYIVPDNAFLQDSKESKEVLFFRYLPQLWYTHSIPNNIREFWFYQRPDILKYMLDNYEQLGINFYPDEILQYLEKHHLSIEDFINLSNDNMDVINNLITSTLILQSFYSG